MNTVGKKQVAGTYAFDAVNGHTYAADAPWTGDGRFIKLSALLDGLNGGSDQALRAFIGLDGVSYLGPEVVVPGGTPKGWFDLPLVDEDSRPIPVPHPTRENYVQNPSAEVDALQVASGSYFGDFATTTALTRQTTSWGASPGRQGAASFYFKLTKGATSTNSRAFFRPYLTPAGTVMPAEPGEVIAASTALQVIDGPNVTTGAWRLHVQFTGDAGILRDDVSGPLAPDGTTGRIGFVSSPAPANTTGVTVSLIADSSTSGDIVEARFDGFLVEKSASVGSYFEGKTQGSASTLRIGVAAGLGDSVNLYGDNDGGGFDILPSTSSAGPTPSLFASYIQEWSPSSMMDDAALARLPYIEAQAAFGGGAGVLSSRTSLVGWHGLRFDREVGSFAIVNPLGPLAALVGERVRVTVGKRSVCAYVHTDADIVEDISLARRLFLTLAPLAETDLRGRIEVLS